MTQSYKILFGDIHNHNAHGYGVGSIERSLEVARTHLDFFAFTGHSSWHDMPSMEGGRERHWIDGFRRLKETWPQVQKVIADGNRDREFCAFLGFEWHSSEWGDHCVVFPTDHRPIFYTAQVPELRQFCRREGALMIPHHLAYPKGRRGVDWGCFDEACTPVVEVYSEHGNSADDRGAYPFFTHSMGGRETSNTADAALAAGLRFGFVGSSDNHAGFPGAYGEGLMGALVQDFSRDGIFEAINARRTYALTGDRIEVDFEVNGAPMGSGIESGGQAEVTYSVDARDEIEVVELIQDGCIVHRDYAEQKPAGADVFDSSIQIRLEWGWGPWEALALDRICDWQMRIQVTDGKIARIFPCLQSMPFDEQRRHRFEREGETALNVRSYTSRKNAYRENPNQSVVLELIGDASTRLDLSLTEPETQSTSCTLGNLLEGSANYFTGPFPKESFQWHRLIPARTSSVRGRCSIDVPVERTNIHMRVKQRNGHMAWVSPVFVNYR